DISLKKVDDESSVCSQQAFYESSPTAAEVDARASLDCNDFPYDVTAAGKGGLKAPRETIRAMHRGGREAGALPSRMTVATAHRRRRRTAHTLSELPEKTGEKRSLQRSKSVGALREDTAKRQRRGSDGHAVWQEWFDEAKENAGWVWDSVSRFGMKLKSSADHLLEEVSRALDSDDEKPN
ncbi:hypothetical protein FOZ63_007745, partial [Perkinsus olseni]